MSKITLCSIMLNEEQYLPTFLQNIKGLFEDYIFVDGGSSDNSIALVEAEGYKVEQIPFVMDFAKQKNNALNLAKTKWRLFLDIDETMSLGIKKLIKTDIDPYYHHVFALFRDNFLDGGGQDDYPLDIPIRLFGDDVYYEGTVHEQPIVKDKTIIKFLGGRLYHKKDSYRQFRANYIYELIRRGVKELPPADEGAFNDNGRLRKVKLLPGRKIRILDEFVEGQLLNT